MITAEHLRKIVHYDQSTGVFTALIPRGKIQAGDEMGSVNKGRRLITIEWLRYSAHRLAWLYVYGAWPRGVIDHINGDPLDNRIANLRDVTQSVNLQNQRRARSNNRQGLLGVQRVASKAIRYRATISHQGRGLHLGCFDAPDDAHAAYLTAKRRLHVGCAI